MLRLGLSLVLLALCARADVTLAPLFRDGAVLQRDCPIPVWGKAAPGEPIRVRLAAASAETKADEHGRWSVALPAQAANAMATDLVVDGRNHLVVTDVVIGDVWLCAGQSNMMMSVDHAADAAQETAAADLPLLREFKVAAQFSATPQDSVGGAWRTCSPTTFGSFSAVAGFFGRALVRELGVPIGLVTSAYGNTPIASWRQADAVARDEEVGRWWEATSKSTPPPRPHRQPSACYNGMIHPLEPYACRGVLWYQGESDASEASALAPIYGRQFTRLIQEWRTQFRQPELPFFWVELAGYGQAGARAWVEVRAEQAKALALPGTAQASAIDVGDAQDIHPKRKQVVGERLARLALHRVYGRDLEDTGPEPDSAAFAEGVVRLRMKHATGLTAAGNLARVCELAGSDGVFHPVAAAAVSGESLVLTPIAGHIPTAVRFSWQADPPAALHNWAGLPASSFRLQVSTPIEPTQSLEPARPAVTPHLTQP